MSWLAAAATGLQAIMPIVGAQLQSKENKRVAERQHAQNMELLKYQLDYNSPANQMERFKQAGLNPNLMYNQGNPGNMSSAPAYPDIKPVDRQGMATQMAAAAQSMAGLKLTEAQTDLTRQKINESGVKQDLMGAQTAATNANPWLNKDYVNSMVSTLKAAASMKTQEAEFMSTHQQIYDEKGNPTGWKESNGFRKMEAELKVLENKFNLGQADQRIKAQIIESKEFQNELQRIQVEWMRDAEITPQHIYQGIMILLSKLIGKKWN